MLWLLLASCALLSKDKPFDVDVGLLDDATLGEVPLAPLDLEVQLFDERPSWYLPAFHDNEGWGELMLADAVLRAAGEPELLSVAVGELVWEAPEPITLQLTVSSEADRRFVVGPAAPAVEPEACTLEVTTETTPEAHAADLLACLQAWADANGGPVDVYLEVLAETEAVDWAFTATYDLDTTRPAEVTCTGPQIVDEELRAEADNVELEALELAGYVGGADAGLAVVAWENSWEGDLPEPAAGAWALVSAAAGEGRFVGRELELLEPAPGVVFAGAPEPVTYFPADWVDVSVAALGSPDGFVDACAVLVHDALPNEVTMHFALVGDGVYHGGG